MKERRPRHTGNIEQNKETKRFRGRYHYNYQFFRTPYFKTRVEAEQSLAKLIKNTNKLKKGGK